jgi:hypothetical protein
MVPKLLGVTPHRAAQDLGFYGTGEEISLSRPACVPAAPPATPRRARGVTSREVSRCYVAACRRGSRAARRRGPAMGRSIHESVETPLIHSEMNLSLIHWKIHACRLMSLIR